MDEFIDIKEKNGTIKKAKVIFRVYNEKKDNYYIVYKYNEEYFAAKYQDVVGTSKLDTNLNNKEIGELEKILNNIEE